MNLSVNQDVSSIDVLYNAQASLACSGVAPSYKERRQKLKNLLSALFIHRDELLNALLDDLGKPTLETEVVEFHPTVAELKFALRNLRRWMDERLVPTPLSLLGSRNIVRIEPKGHCLIITPWNYPIWLTMAAVISAVAAGNRVVIKPSEYVDKTAKAMEKVLLSVFSTEEVCMVYGDHHIAQHLLQKPWNHIHFTGSTPIGKVVMKAAAESLSSVTLELGGKSPTIIAEDANIRLAAQRIAWGKWIGAGQTCLAPDLIYVHRHHTDTLVKALKDYLANAYNNDAIQSNHYCSLIHERHFDRQQDFLQEAKDAGAKIAYGGAADKKSLRMEPTIVMGNLSNTALLAEEIFGPIMPIIIYDSLEELVTELQQRPRPLGLYIFSRQKKTINYILERCPSGGVCINDTVLHIANPNLPFGGMNASGIGKSHGQHGFLDFSNERSVFEQRSPLSSASLTYPPYTKWTQRLIRLITRWLS
tara:strand:+ start:11955 stop:13379 length:1425 start_codon:yes stop_codon:yes gene_type:complete